MAGLKSTHAAVASGGGGEGVGTVRRAKEIPCRELRNECSGLGELAWANIPDVRQ
jgi:hypothetical protein